MLGRKSFHPGVLEEATSGLPLPFSRWLLFWRQKSPYGLYALWDWSAGSYSKVSEILVALAEQILHAAETVSQDLKKKKQHYIPSFWISDCCNVQFPWSHQSWFMFNWNWAGLIPLFLALVQIWSDAIFKPRVNKKETDLGPGGLMYVSLLCKYGLTSLGKRKRCLTFLIWTVLCIFFFLPTYHKLAYILFCGVSELFDKVCWLVIFSCG